MAQKPFEQYTVGEKFISYGRTVSEADLVNFTALAGLKLPMFIDEDYCRNHSIFGTRVMPGLFTASIAAGMLEDVLGRDTLAALELTDLKFSSPVKIGDTLHTRVVVEATRKIDDESRGLLSVGVEVVNQHDDVPCTFSVVFMMRAGNGEAR